MKITIEDHPTNPNYEVVNVELGLEDISLRQFALDIAPQLAEQYKLLVIGYDEESKYFHLSPTSDSLYGIRKKENFMSEETIQDPMTEEVQPAVAEPIGDIPFVAPVEHAYPDLTPEDANEVCQAWERGPLSDELHDRMRSKYSVVGADLTRKIDGGVSFCRKDIPAPQEAA